MRNKKHYLVAEKYESRNTIDSLRAIMAETYILSRCNYIVCTLSSNVILYSYLTLCIKMVKKFKLPLINFFSTLRYI